MVLAFVLVPPVLSLWPPPIHSPSAFLAFVLLFSSPSSLVVYAIDMIAVTYMYSVVCAFMVLYVVSVVTFTAVVVVVGMYVLGLVFAVVVFTVVVMLLI